MNTGPQEVPWGWTAEEWAEYQRDPEAWQEAHPMGGELFGFPIVEGEVGLPPIELGCG